MKTRLLIIIPIVAILFAAIFFAIDSTNMDKICAEKGGVRNEDVCMIELGEPPVTEKSDFDLSNIKSMSPNSIEIFYYPNPEDAENRDVFQTFILIRLPEELGGGVDDVSAFRAYSMLSVGEHCLAKYWPDEGRKRMEDPCWGSMYRPLDGVMIVGPKPIVNITPVALPYLDLSIDEKGSLYVEPPVWTLDKNGVIGVGRNISMQEIRDGSAFLVDSIMKSHPNHPEIPVTFGTHTLTQIHSSGSIDAMYFNFSPVSDYVYLTVDNTSAQDQEYFPNLALRNSEVWQIGDTPVQISGTGYDERGDYPYYKQYKAMFLKDGFTFTVQGRDLELIKSGIVANFFPDNSYGDLYLVSSTVEK